MSDTENSDSPRQRRVERERKRRREDIIKTAKRLFISQGFEQTMMDQIAKEAGFSKATIYKYFETKDILYLAVAAIAFEKLYQCIENTLSRPEVKYEIRSLGDAYLAFVQDYPSYAKLIYVGRIGAALTRIIEKEETKQPLNESEQEFRIQQQRIGDIFTQIIAATLKNANVQTDVSPLTIVIALSYLGMAITELALRSKAENQSKEEARDYVSVIFNIIDKGLKHYDD